MTVYVGRVNWCSIAVLTSLQEIRIGPKISRNLSRKNTPATTAFIISVFRASFYFRPSSIKLLMPRMTFQHLIVLNISYLNVQSKVGLGYRNLSATLKCGDRPIIV